MQSHGQTQNLLSTDKMRLFVTFLVTLFCTGCHLQKVCPGHGWSSSETICYRIVHFPESFWGAYGWCKTVQGSLLSLKNVKEVMDALGDTMEGNAGEYRIDGWAEGKWFHKNNETLEHEDYELLSELSGKTLTVDLQDGKVHSNTEEGTRLGFICEGSGEEVACTNEGSSSSTEESETNLPPPPSTEGPPVIVTTVAPPPPPPPPSPPPPPAAVEPSQLPSSLVAMDYTPFILADFAPASYPPDVHPQAWITVMESYRDGIKQDCLEATCDNSQVMQSKQEESGAINVATRLNIFDGVYAISVGFRAGPASAYDKEPGDAKITFLPPARDPTAAPNAMFNDANFGRNVSFNAFCVDGKSLESVQIGTATKTTEEDKMEFLELCKSYFP